MMQTITLGLSPCPNDTSLFHGLLSGRVPLPGVALSPRIEDVATLNRLASERALQVTKISMHAFGHVRQDYALLRSGAALGVGYGPLVVTKRRMAPERLEECRIAVPGPLTTAGLLLQLFGIEVKKMVHMPFHAIAKAVSDGLVAAGVLIHETRFTCETMGLHKVLDLGIWWETLTGLPLPLGGIAARRDLSPAIGDLLEEGIRQSIDAYAGQPESARDFIRHHARETDDAALDGHIGLYVNGYTRDLGETGETAVRELLARAVTAGLLPPCSFDLFR